MAASANKPRERNDMNISTTVVGMDLIDNSSLDQYLNECKWIVYITVFLWII